MPKLQKSILVTDLDNTLWDWVSIWYVPFTSMLSKVLAKGEVDRETFLDEARSVFQRFGTTEYAFLLEQLPSLRLNRSREEVLALYNDAISEYRNRRREVLTTYPTVFETLSTIRDSGATIIGYTESLSYYSEYRLRKAGIASLFTALYSPADHELPDDRTRIRKYEEEDYGLPVPHLHTPPGIAKPNPTVLLEILRSVNAAPEDAVYIGDSIPKDIGMAQRAGVLDVHASYGVAQHTEAYQLLRRVSHWTDEEIQREKQIILKPPHAPTIVLKDSFAELLQHVHFGSTL